MKTILELKAWLTGKKMETPSEQSNTAPETTAQTTPETTSQETPGEVAPEAGQETPGEITPSQDAPVTAEELTAREGELLTLATNLQTLEATITARETALNERESKLAEKEKTTGALASVVGNVTAPVKPESNSAAALAAYNAEKDPSKRFQMFRKNKDTIRKAK